MSNKFESTQDIELDETDRELEEEKVEEVKEEEEVYISPIRPLSERTNTTTILRSIWKSKWCLIVSLVLALFLLVPIHSSNKLSDQPSDEHSNSANSNDSNANKTTDSTSPSVKLPTVPGDDDEYLAICANIANQAKDLPEWFIHHYYHLGIRRFYIMDDGTVPPLSESIPDLGIPSSAVTFVYFSPKEGRSGMQLYLYNQCNKRFGMKHTWMGFIDADEFLEMTSKNETLVSFLKSFEDNKSVGAVAVNWQIHTSSGLLERPPSCRKAFTTCLDDSAIVKIGDNRQFKWFVRTNDYESAHTAHDFNLKRPTYAVGEYGDRIFGDYRKSITRDRIALHHYVIKSKQEYEEKLGRDDSMHSVFKRRNWDYWYQLENATHVSCPSMSKYDP